MSSEKKQIRQLWFVYMVLCSDKTFYTGITTDITRRITEHNCNRRGAKYTRSRRPVKLVYQECYENRSAASQREYILKHLSPRQKQQLLISSDDSP